MTPRRALFTAVLAACILTTACSRPDTTPLPTTASPPFVCDHVPLQAVERMTGPCASPAKGSSAGSGGWGSRRVVRIVYRPDEEEVKVLDIELATDNDPGRVESEVRDGAKRLPEDSRGRGRLLFRDPVRGSRGCARGPDPGEVHARRGHGPRRGRP